MAKDPLDFWDRGARDTSSDSSNVTLRGGVAPPVSRFERYPGIQSFIPDLTSQATEDGLSSWEIIYFNNIRVPGICRVEGGRRRLIDHRGTPGSSGEIASLMAYALAEFAVTLTIWTAQQWTNIASLFGIIYPKETVSPVSPGFPTGPNAPLVGVVPGSTAPNAPFVASPAKAIVSTVSVRHPAFQFLKVNDVYIVDVRAPRHVGSQVMEVVVDCIEFKQPSNEGVRKFGSVQENNDGTYNAVPVKSPPPGPDQTSVGP